MIKILFASKTGSIPWGVRTSDGAEYSRAQWRALNADYTTFCVQRLVDFYGKERIAQALQVSEGQVIKIIKQKKLSLEHGQKLRRLEEQFAAAKASVLESLANLGSDNVRNNRIRILQTFKLEVRLLEKAN